MSRSRLILHVTESYGGGVASAIDEYVHSTPDLTHVLLRSVREKDHRSDDSSTTGFCNVVNLPRHPLQAARVLRSTVAQLSPDVVHAHSSIGGAIVRATSFSGEQAPRIVYTPHCFAFERRDTSVLTRAMFRLAELALTRRAHVIAGCSPREESLARSMAARSTIFVPNICEPIAPRSEDTLPRLLVGAGRLGPQKNPQLFADVMRELVPAGWQGLWVGGERAEVPSAFEGLPVEVTGWLTREHAMTQMQTGAAYFHSAKWEGFPMAILEASAMALPIVANRIPALEGMPRKWQFSGAAVIAQAIHEIDSDPKMRTENVEDWRQALSPNTRAQQRSALMSAYGIRSHDMTQPLVGTRSGSSR